MDDWFVFATQSSHSLGKAAPITSNRIAPYFSRRTILRSWLANSRFGVIVSEGFGVVGWVTMWRPVEVVMYDWWPLRVQKINLSMIASMNVEILCANSLKASTPRKSDLRLVSLDRRKEGNVLEHSSGRAAISLVICHS